MSKRPLIRLDHITLRVRDKFLFEDTCWEIHPGQHWAIIGPNGAGKTSLVGAIAGDVPVVRGNVRRIDQGLTTDRIGLVSFERHRQLIAREEARDEARYFSNSLDDLLTTRQTLQAGRKTQSTSNDAFKRVVTRLGLEELLERPVRSLSTGEVRNVLIAKELVRLPRLLILDEPFDGLDATARNRLGRMITDLMHSRIQIVLVTHRLDEILSGITHILAVKKGRVVFQGKRKDGLEPGRIERLYRAGQKAVSLPSREETYRDSFEGRKNTSLVSMRNVTVTFGDVTVLRGLNWTMRWGENWAIVGPNGSGKTTLLRLIAADHSQAYANEIYLFGKRRGSGESIWDIKRHIGLISSEFQIRYRKPICVFDVVLSGFFDSVGLYRHSTGEQRKTAGRWLDILDLKDKAERLFHTLSQGEQRLVLLARSMVKAPTLLILDEPCQGLDRVATKNMLNVMEIIGRRAETHLLYVTHHPKEMLACITNILRFEKTGTGEYNVVFDAVKNPKRKE